MTRQDLGDVLFVFAVVFLGALLSGCAHRAKVVDPITFKEVAEHNPPKLEALVVNEPVVMLPPKYETLAPGACTDTGGFLVQSEKDLPPFVGYLIARDDWLRLVEAYPRRVEEIEDLVKQLGEVIRHAKTVDAAKIEAILACRESKKEAFGAGVAIGAGGCAAIYGGLDRIPSP